MLIDTLWTVHNHNTQQTVVWLFEVGDKARMATIGSKLYVIPGGKSASIRLKPERVVLEFRDGKLPLPASTRMGGPTEVSTFHDGFLSAEGEAGYLPTRSRWPAEETSAIDFISAEEANNLARMIVIWGLGKIPKAGGLDFGGALSSVVGFIWKDIKPDINDLIEQSENRMRAWVRGRIEAHDREKLRDRLSGLHKNLTSFVQFTDPSTRGKWLVSQLTLFNFVQGEYATRGYTQGTLAMIVDLATMHLTLLREAVMFPDDLAIEESDRSAYAKLLTEAIAEYQDFILNIAIPAELEWRRGQMDISDDTELSPEEVIIHDNVTSQVHRFARNMALKPPSFDIGVNRDLFVAQVINGYANELQANIGDPARLWTLLDPAQSGARPIALDRLTWVGPCSGLAQKLGNQHRAEAQTRLEAIGDVRKIELRAKDNADRDRRELEYIKLHFADGTSKAIGIGSGKTEIFELPDGVYITEIETWFDSELSGLRFHTSDGQTSKVFGTSQFPDGARPRRYVNRAGLQNHRLAGVRIEGNDRGAPIGHAISFAFMPMPDFYDVEEVD